MVKHEIMGPGQGHEKEGKSYSSFMAETLNSVTTQLHRF
jgi:hypothetical protein